MYSTDVIVSKYFQYMVGWLEINQDDSLSLSFSVYT